MLALLLPVITGACIDVLLSRVKRLGVRVGLALVVCGVVDAVVCRAGPPDALIGVAFIVVFALAGCGVGVVEAVRWVGSTSAPPALGTTAELVAIAALATAAGVGLVFAPIGSEWWGWFLLFWCAAPAYAAFERALGLRLRRTKVALVGRRLEAQRPLSRRAWTLDLDPRSVSRVEPVELALHAARMWRIKVSSEALGSTTIPGAFDVESDAQELHLRIEEALGSSRPMDED